MSSVRRSITILGAATLVLGGGAAQAATLLGIQGQVMVDRGSGFVEVTGPTELEAGDSVVVGPDSTAQLAYPDGTVTTVEPGMVVTVAEAAAAAAAGVAPVVATTPAVTATTLAVGAAVVGTAVGIAVVVNEQQDKQPSP